MNKSTQPEVKKAALSALERRKQAQENDLRTRLAIGFGIIYLLFILSVVAFWGYDLFQPVQGRTDKVKDLILTVYGILSGPLGLIIGYYFGSDNKKP